MPKAASKLTLNCPGSGGTHLLQAGSKFRFEMAVDVLWLANINSDLSIILLPIYGVCSYTEFLLNHSSQATIKINSWISHETCEIASIHYKSESANHNCSLFRFAKYFTYRQSSNTWITVSAATLQKGENEYSTILRFAKLRKVGSEFNAILHKNNLTFAGILARQMHMNFELELEFFPSTLLVDLAPIQLRAI